MGPVLGRDRTYFSLFHRKLRPMKQKTLREDAHSREAETCRKRPRSARECAKAHSFSNVKETGYAE